MEKGSSYFKVMGNREIQVCQTLLNLKTLIPKFELLRNLNWKNKKLRSVKRIIPNPNPLLHLGFINEESENNPKSKETESNPEGKRASPTRSHDFPDSTESDQSDERPTQPRPKSSKKRTIEELLEMLKTKLKTLEPNREVLRREVEKVKSYESKQRAINLELKAAKKQFLLRPTNPQPKNQDHLRSTSLLGQSTTVYFGSNGSNKRLRC